MVRILVVCLSLMLTACESVSFYTQAIRGQIAIFSKREDIADLVADPATDPVLKQQLETILDIRTFAESELSLPVSKNFSTYADIGRPYVVWNVFAAPEFSLSSRQWCYPVAGCVSYRGYFAEEDARAYADDLADEGLDVYVGGVAAYSTLGWFSDPVLNTVIRRDRYRLAALIFHELAHQVVYIPGDTEFNESFATTVELEGLKRWLDATGEDDAEERVAQASREKQYQQQFVGLVQAYLPRFAALYESGVDEAAMRREKQQLVSDLREEYQGLKADWDGFDAYDNWFATDINNAKLNTVATYFNRVPAFEQILAESGNDLTVFFQRIEALAALSKEERKSYLDGLAP